MIAETPPVATRKRPIEFIANLHGQFPASTAVPSEDSSRIGRSRSLIVQWNYESFGSDRPQICGRSLHGKGEAMNKILMAGVAVATLAVSAMAVPDPAHAQRGVAAGVAAGLIASQNPYYGPGYYGPGYGYYGGGPAYVVEQDCGWQRQRFWDGYGWRVRNVRVCY
jgi:hypothetical protein